MPAYVCGDPDAIDAAWMTQALDEAGVARGATITGLELAGFIGTGQTGCNARYLLQWDQPEGRPASVVGKFASRDPAASAAAFASETYRNEWEFYDTLAHTLQVRAPLCYAARYDAEAPDFVLVMEDLADCRQGDQFAGLDLDQAALAVEQAVGLHAPRWGDPTLEQFAAHRPKGPERGQVLAMVYSMMVDPFLARLGAGLDDDIIELVHATVAHIATWTAATDTPLTVAHMDYRPDNFMFGVTPDAPPLAVVDWQTATHGMAMNDLAYLFGGCFEPSTRAAVERDLLTDYRQRMAAAGVIYDENAMWHDYRFASLWGVIMTVIATVMAAQTERGDAMLTVMGQRHGRHALDLNALELLR
jgi:Phosphotransferase enzyme family